MPGGWTKIQLLRSNLATAKATRRLSITSRTTYIATLPEDLRDILYFIFCEMTTRSRRTATGFNSRNRLRTSPHFLPRGGYTFLESAVLLMVCSNSFWLDQGIREDSIRRACRSSPHTRKKGLGYDDNG